MEPVPANTMEVSTFCATFGRCCSYPPLISLTPVIHLLMSLTGLGVSWFWQKRGKHTVSVGDVRRLEAASDNTCFVFPRETSSCHNLCSASFLNCTVQRQCLCLSSTPLFASHSCCVQKMMQGSALSESVVFLWLWLLENKLNYRLFLGGTLCLSFNLLNKKTHACILK